MPHLTAKQKGILNFIELIIVLVFSLEYLLRLYAAPKKLKFVFSFLGIVDLLAILPFYIAGLDLRAIRFMRLFRIIRLLKLTRYNKALQRIYRAFVLAKEELSLFLFCLFLLLYLASIAIYYFENKEWFSSDTQIRLQTSGTVAKKTYFLREKKYLSFSAKESLSVLKIPNQAKTLLCLPANYIAAQLMLIRALIGNLCLHCIAPRCKNLWKSAKVVLISQLWYLTSFIVL